MFDTAAVLPRQGAAVFAEGIRSIQGILHDGKSLDATVLQTFDAHTAEHTMKLAESYRRSADNSRPGRRSRS